MGGGGGVSKIWHKMTEGVWEGPKKDDVIYEQPHIIIILTKVSVFFYQWHSYFRFSVWSLSKIVSGLMDDREKILNGSYIEAIWNIFFDLK